MFIRIVFNSFKNIGLYFLLCFGFYEGIERLLLEDVKFNVYLVMFSCEFIDCSRYYNLLCYLISVFYF